MNAVAAKARCTPREYQRRYDLIASDHLAHHRNYGTNPWMPHDAELRAWTLSMVKALVPEGCSVLDCGCGIGTFLADLDQHYDAVGIDIADAYLYHCRERGLEVAHGWLEDIPYPDGVFDAAVCVDVLEHVLDPAKAAAEVRRVVKRRGVVVARVPDPAVAAVGQGGDDYEFPVHLQSYTAPELAELFDARLVVADLQRKELLVGMTL